MNTPDLRIHDTLAGERRSFEPIESGRIRMYVCGVTVYDFSHIGHGRTFVTFDIVVRYLRSLGYDVNFVRNHTDIDDKIIKRANEHGEEALALASRFIQALDEDLERLGCVPPNAAPRVSDHLDDIVSMVERLIEKGHAYPVDGDVYYAVESFEGYGKLSGRKLEDMRAGERVAVDQRKRNPFDFALWKGAKPGEPSWESPWGLGRPGWHIECSAMSTALLGDTIDIHGGGGDLTFPHHENEIAQSEGATGCHFANYWMHVAMLNIDGEKMSKSLGNFWTIRDVLETHHREVLRYFMMTAHYRKQVNYSLQNLEAARDRIIYLYEARESAEKLLERIEPTPAPDADWLASKLERANTAMSDDFNTPVLIAIINEVARELNEFVTTKKVAKKADVLAKIAAALEFFRVTSAYTGILAEPASETLGDISALLVRELGLDEAEVDGLVAEREAARQNKDWALADELRDRLAALQVALMDGAEGTRWRVRPSSVDSESA